MAWGYKLGACIDLGIDKVCLVKQSLLFDCLDGRSRELIKTTENGRQHAGYFSCPVMRI